MHRTLVKALDGCRWPSTNPKTLSVRFGRQDEVDYPSLNNPFTHTLL